jgi:hypothetical protein
MLLHQLIQNLSEFLMTDTYAVIVCSPVTSITNMQGLLHFFNHPVLSPSH